MRAPDVVRNSPLPWRTGQWATESWMDVDRGSLGFFGGFAALALMAWVTLSGFSGAGGPVDWLLVGVIWGVGVVGGVVLSYAVLGLFDRSHAKQGY